MQRKSLSLLVLCAFLGQTLTAEAALRPAAPATPHAPTIASILEYPQTLRVDPNTARVRDIYKGTNGRLIIHIQDAHANFGAQKNLAKAMDEISSRFGIGLVLVEGSSTDVTLDWLKPALAAPAPHLRHLGLKRSAYLDGAGDGAAASSAETTL